MPGRRVLEKLLRRSAERRRREAVEAQLPAALDLFAGSLRAGLSFLQALQYVSEETPAPLSEETARIVRDQQLGVPLEDSLREWARRTASEDVELACAAILIARRSGGNLAGILQRLAATVRERRQLRHQLHVLTAQGRMSGWILSAMPIALLGLLAAFDPHYVAPLLTSGAGWLLLAVGGAMEVAGAAMIRRIVTLDA